MKETELTGGIIKVEKKFLTSKNATPLLKFWKEHMPEKYAQFQSYCDVVAQDPSIHMSAFEMFEVVLNLMIKHDFILHMDQSGKNYKDMNQDEARIAELIRKMGSEAVNLIHRNKGEVIQRDILDELRDGFKEIEITRIRVRKKSGADELDEMLEAEESEYEIEEE